MEVNTTGGFSENQARVVGLTKQQNVNSKLNIVIDELIANIENAQLHESGLIIKYINKFKLDMVVSEFQMVVHILICHYGLKTKKHV